LHHDVGGRARAHKHAPTLRRTYWWRELACRRWGQGNRARARRRCEGAHCRVGLGSEDDSARRPAPTPSSALRAIETALQDVQQLRPAADPEAIARLRTAALIVRVIATNNMRQATLKFASGRAHSGVLARYECIMTRAFSLWDHGRRPFLLIQRGKPERARETAERTGPRARRAWN
jgi:hypothetical protein